MAVTLEETDQISEFDYDSDDETAPDPFSLTKLTEIVSTTAEKDCTLVKLVEGGYHKIHDVLSDGQPAGIVARVAAPAFPKDKLESEIATMQYVASHTNIHTPRVHGRTTPLSEKGEFFILWNLQPLAANELSKTNRIFFQVLPLPH
ncbi:hypothetical protein R3P38DRAFT_1355404 [Favolaschia claudopus]|uniref:Protein kinase domain-containing protein n=1 Tax=Favolaschia claudopus TaxID=2862362 RepID=A0AAW0DWW0_9AGAR